MYVRFGYRKGSASVYVYLKGFIRHRIIKRWRNKHWCILISSPWGKKILFSLLLFSVFPIFDLSTNLLKIIFQEIDQCLRWEKENFLNCAFPFLWGLFYFVARSKFFFFCFLFTKKSSAHIQKKLLHSMKYVFNRSS